MCECCDEGRCAGGCRYLMEVGSTRLPLKGIVDDTIGQRLQYEAANQRELSPLFAAIQKNSSLRLLAVSKMQSADVLEVRRPSPPPPPPPACSACPRSASPPPPPCNRSIRSAPITRASSTRPRRSRVLLLERLGGAPRLSGAVHLRPAPCAAGAAATWGRMPPPRDGRYPPRDGRYAATVRLLKVGQSAQAVSTDTATIVGRRLLTAGCGCV